MVDSSGPIPLSLLGPFPLQCDKSLSPEIFFSGFSKPASALCQSCNLPGQPPPSPCSSSSTFLVDTQCYRLLPQILDFVALKTVGVVFAVTADPTPINPKQWGILSLY